METTQGSYGSTAGKQQESGVKFSAVGIEKHKEGGSCGLTDPSLGDIRGVSYIYGMFYRFELIDVPDTARQKMKCL